MNIKDDLFCAECIFGGVMLFGAVFYGSMLLLWPMIIN